MICIFFVFHAAAKCYFIKMLAFHILSPERLLTFWASGTFCPPTLERTACNFFPSGKQGQPLPAGDEEDEAVVLVSWDPGKWQFLGPVPSWGASIQQIWGGAGRSIVGQLPGHLARRGPVVSASVNPFKLLLSTPLLQTHVCSIWVTKEFFLHLRFLNYHR